MNPIETLTAEHRIIKQALSAFEAWASQVKEHRKDDRHELKRFIEFIREFVDGCHHGKEEKILFEAMIEQGFPRQQGPIAVMLHEHDQGRVLVQTLSRLAEAQAGWSDDDRQALGNAVRTYASLMRQHINKEDNVLYPMAKARLAGPSMEDLARRFERFEARETGPGEHERLHALAGSLIEQHGPASSPD